jgi:hypothetical protein
VATHDHFEQELAELESDDYAFDRHEQQKRSKRSITSWIRFESSHFDFHDCVLQLKIKPEQRKVHWAN